MPTLTSIELSQALAAFHIRTQSVNAPKFEVVNAYEIHLPDHRRIVGLHCCGFLPVEITLDDESCFLIDAEYIDGVFKNGKIVQKSCSAPRPSSEADLPAPPHLDMSLAGRAWGYVAWRDNKSGTTTVVDESSKDHPAIFDIGMAVVGMGVMRGPDTPGGEISLLGQLNGKPALVTVLYRP
ncbi:MAG: hypothetical protein EOO38_20165 [Cytophagaceae bacterium]|nr:MAG: hypothetical protein EOO38_20165 [Cytophagaceae bacterium]